MRVQREVRNTEERTYMVLNNTQIIFNRSLVQMSKGLLQRIQMDIRNVLLKLVKGESLYSGRMLS